MGTYDIPDFVPQNDSQQAALDIANKLNDRTNLKFHLKAVNTLGILVSTRLLNTVIENENTRNPAKFYTYLVKLEISTKKNRGKNTEIREQINQLSKKMGAP
jgi:hypothetical protein